MKGGDETHVVGLGSSLHRSLPLVLFLCFWLVFCFLFFVLCFLDFGFVVVEGGGVIVDDGDGCDER
jgi:hypothetical protein